MSLVSLLKNFEIDTGDNLSSNRIIQYILERMCSGVYLPGSHINENKISKELKISNIPVREAVVHLIHINLVERLPQRGLFVKKLSVKELEDLYEVRQDIEARTIRKVAGSISDRQLARLREVVDLLNQDEESFYFEGQFQKIIGISASQTPPDSQNGGGDSLPRTEADRYYNYLKGDVEFHMLLMHFAGNKVYKKLAESFIPRAVFGYRLYFQILQNPDLQQLFAHVMQRNQGKNIKLVYHEQIYSALEAHDADLAEQLMRDHLTQSYYSKLAKMELLTHLHSLHGLMTPCREIISQAI